MIENKESFIRRTLEPVTPDFARLTIKRLYQFIIRYRNKLIYIEKGKRAELGYRFRFERLDPYKAYIGNRTIIEDSNIWNANVGDIKVGQRCWFGLNNIVMGPVDVGDNFSSGPYVSILGPRHAVLGKDENRREKTVIEDNVWISTGSIIFFGVYIGENAIVGPGSVVTKDVPAGSYVAGNPARNLTKIATTIWNKNDENI